MQDEYDSSNISSMWWKMGEYEHVIKHEWFIKFPWNKKGKKESKTFL